MSNIDNFEVSERIFRRMTTDGSSIPAIVSVLKEVNPKASNEDLILFMAKCVERSRAKDESSKSPSLQPSKRNRMTSSSCTGSSTSSCC